MPELATNSILAPVAACSKTVKLVPSRSTKERLSLRLASWGRGLANEKGRRASHKIMGWIDDNIVRRQRLKNGAASQCSEAHGSKAHLIQKWAFVRHFLSMATFTIRVAELSKYVRKPGLSFGVKP